MPETSAASGDDPDFQLTDTRLQDLPLDLLHRVLPLAGRPARLVCRRACRAHGPLSGGLHLTAAGCQELLQLAATTSITSLARIRTLVVYRPSPHNVIPALPSILPALQSLRLPGATLEPSTLAALAPLSRTLTQISNFIVDLPALSALTSALPSLRSLHLTLAGGAVLDSLTLLAGGLPNLLHLQLDSDNRYMMPSAANLLGSLARGLPHLTSLFLHTPLRYWNQTAAATLASAWPHLADLAISFEDYAGYPGPLPMGAAAALAQHTALTRLHISTSGDDAGEWGQLQALQLRELRLASRCTTPQPHWAVTAAPGIMNGVTSLALSGTSFVLDHNMARHLSRMGARLVSLRLFGIVIPSWRPLAQLSCLSRLQDLTLDGCWHGYTPYGDRDSDGTVEQAARVLASGLQNLCFLDVQTSCHEKALPALVAGLPANGRLRELYALSFKLRQPVRLMAVADSLARLTISASTMSVVLTISALKGLHQLHWLQVRLLDEQRGRGGGEVQWPLRHDGPMLVGQDEWHMLVAGAQVAHGQYHGPGQVWLPPRLRVLVVADMHWLAEKVQGVLRQAAGQQSCVIVDALVDKVPAEWDDCGGYEEGASLQWLRRHGRL